MCRQAGFVLIALLALLMLVGSAALLSQLEWAGERARIARDQRTSETLAETGAALVAYAVTNVNAPGRLPFPDRGSDGNFGTPNADARRRHVVPQVGAVRAVLGDE